VGDFNGDGDSDILWRDSTGNTSIWFVERYAGFVLRWPQQHCHKLIGFNGDGMSDIVWQDCGTKGVCSCATSLLLLCW
jgi:hypothetical protein